MPIPKPTPADLPRWATGVGADVIEPPDGQKDAGWVPGDRPPAQTENWLKRQTFKWLEWLNDIEAQDIAWLGRHQFTNVSGVGDDDPGLATPAPVNQQRHVWRFGSGATTTRLYYRSAGHLIVTVNAASGWVSGAVRWARDDATAPAHRFDFGINGAAYYAHAAFGTPDFADSAWAPAQRFRLGSLLEQSSFDGGLTVRGGATVAAAGAVDTAALFLSGVLDLANSARPTYPAAPVTNSLSRYNLINGVARVRANQTATPELDAAASYNVASTGIGASTATVRVNWATPFGNADYACAVRCSGMAHAEITGRGPGYVLVTAWRVDAGAQVYLSEAAISGTWFEIIAVGTA
jgi:hypothetical protein